MGVPIGIFNICGIPYADERLFLEWGFHWDSRVHNSTRASHSFWPHPTFLIFAFASFFPYCWSCAKDIVLGAFSSISFSLGACATAGKLTTEVTKPINNTIINFISTPRLGKPLVFLQHNSYVRSGISETSIISGLNCNQNAVSPEESALPYLFFTGATAMYPEALEPTVQINAGN
jgi:hypothetical protein